MQETEVKDVHLEEEIAPEEGDFEELAAEPAVYEIGYHLLPTLEEDGVVAEAEKIHAFIEKEGGVFISEESPKRVPLAYTMVKAIAGKNERYTQALFVWLKCEMAPEAAEKVKHMLESNAAIIRFLMARTVKEDTMQAGRQFLRSEQKDREKHAAAADDKEKAPLSEEELNKSLEKMIAE